MFTERALLKAKVDLYNIVANHSMQDYLQANYNKGKKKSKKHIPYSLSMETEQAKELYDLVYFGSIDTITQEQEEEIKGLLMVYRLNRTEYLKEAGGTAYFKNSLSQVSE